MNLQLEILLYLIGYNINKYFETKKHLMKENSNLLLNGALSDLTNLIKTEKINCLPDLTVMLKELNIHYLPELEDEYKDISKASLYRIVKGKAPRHRKVFLVRRTIEKMILTKQQQIKDDLEMSAKLNATV